MQFMSEEHRRQLTASLLRITIAADHIARVALGNDDPTPAALEPGSVFAQTGWDGNAPLSSARTNVAASIFSGLEHNKALFDLNRSSRGYSVALALATRGSVESLARAHWLLSASSGDDMIVRHGSLEHSDLAHASRLKQSIRIQDGADSTFRPVSAYRTSISEYLRVGNADVLPVGTTRLAIRLLSEVYLEADIIYSGLSSTAHGQTVSLSNYFDASTSEFEMNDQMRIEYCAYAIELTRHVIDRLLAVYQPDRSNWDRWNQTRDSVFATLGSFLTLRRPHL